MMKKPYQCTIEIINRSPHPLPAYQSKQASGMDLRAFIDKSIILEPFERVLVKTGIYIACQQKSTLKLITVQPDGSKPMPANDFINGHQLSVGMLLLNEV